MDLKVEALNAEDIAHVEEMRSWVRDHFAPGAREKYDTVEDKIRLLQTILDEKWVASDEAWKLQSLGITFGDILVQTLGLTWVAFEDEDGRDPALRDGDTSITLFPMTMISKRIEDGEAVNVVQLLDQTHDAVSRLREQGA
jgi:hypothetical protein